MGEFWGFLMGWNMILEHGVGSASVAKAWSGYLDAAMGNPVQVTKKILNYIHIQLEYLLKTKFYKKHLIKLSLNIC